MVTAGDVVSLFSLTSCTGCGRCGKVCPSGRNGGPCPNDIIEIMVNSQPTSEIHADAWKCLMCHRCSMECPKGIDVTRMMRMLRYISPEIPKRFVKASETLAEQACAFPVNEAVNKKRTDLKLKRIDISEKAVSELKEIIRTTGFRNE